MARPSKLALMSVDALLKLRDDVAGVLRRKAEELNIQLARFTGGEIGNARKKVGRPVGSGRKKHALAGRKLAAKYRDPKTGQSWSGRGMMAGWMTNTIKAGAKKEDFLVNKGRQPRRNPP